MREEILKAVAQPPKVFRYTVSDDVYGNGRCRCKSVVFYIFDFGGTYRFGFCRFERASPVANASRLRPNIYKNHKFVSGQRE